MLEPERAEYLAQASQEGAGNTQEQARPTAMAESPVPVDNVGSDEGDSLDDANAVEEFADQVLTANAEQELDVQDKPRDEPSPDVTVAANLEAGMELTLPLPQDQETDLAPPWIPRNPGLRAT